ncbi:acireductone synthase [Saprospira sp. CCB-QB6]|uniref:acireductone synthase n=1 Tax=Saprospira sp. CCB-QB6 TaxID=3023936 RepID=UPI00234A96D1|nr:acireductone synthase [Saprospira sp. CCB-QB6]WCL80231.1 acireductone synthase [Saprospira sp. CCB-QB6]
MIKYILSDIEGTTTSISFVVDTLFPYFLEQLPLWRQKMDQPEVKAQLEATQALVLAEENKNISLEQAFDYLETWCKADRKAGPLKALQGIVWKAAYLNGQIKGHLYPEVADCLKTWKAKGLQLGIYSSGSVAAQKLLFGYSEAGDLTPLFSHYFDTKVGHKREAQSYQNIQEAIGLPANEILFLSDVPQELAAAQAAGLEVAHLLRPGTAPSKFKGYANFNQIQID